MYVADIEDECLLGVDFLKTLNLENIFKSSFIFSETEKICSRIEKIPNSSYEVPTMLKELFMESCGNLDKLQKFNFSNFLQEFENVFSETIVAGNCDVVEHKINLKDSSPIKQVPRRIPFQMRQEVNNSRNERLGCHREISNPIDIPNCVSEKERWNFEILC